MLLRSLTNPAIPAAQIQSDWNQTTSSALDFIKNKPAIPDAPVQSDWNVSDNTSLAFIKNKPAIPPASGDGALTIKTNGEEASASGSFTANPINCQRADPAENSIQRSRWCSCCRRCMGDRRIWCYQYKPDPTSIRRRSSPTSSRRHTDQRKPWPIPLDRTIPAALQPTSTRYPLRLAPSATWQTF